MDANEEVLVMELLRRCQQIVNTREYHRIKVCLFDANAKFGDTSSATTLKVAFERAAIAVAELIGCGPKNDSAEAQEAERR